MKHQIRFFFVACALSGGTSIAADPRPDEMVARQQAAVELIDSSECTMSLDVRVANKTDSENCTTHYFHTKTAVRSIIQDRGQRWDAIWRDSVRYVMLDKGSSVVASKNGFDNPYTHRCDAWANGLLVLNQPQSVANVPLSQLVKKAQRATASRERTEAGAAVERLRLVFETQDGAGGKATWQLDVDLDPAVNHLVRRVLYTKSGSRRVERELFVAAFKECSPGVFFPERVVGTEKIDGKLDLEHTATFSKIALNPKFSADTFKLKFPSGTMMTDSISRTYYKVDANGNKIGPEKPFPNSPAPPSIGAPAEPGPPAGGGTETQVEPEESRPWLLILSVASLCAVIVALVVRRWRSKSEA